MSTILSVALVIAGSGVLVGAEPFPSSRTAPVFPVEFEQSRSGWVARGPGYALALEGGNAILTASDGRGHAGAIRMEILGARKVPAGVPEREAPGRRNYLTGADPARWRTNVRLWEQVRFAGVLDGVDFVYHGGRRRFEYDMVIAPGVDTGVIEVSFTGADELKLDQSGDLVMSTAAGQVIQRRPVAYQIDGGERREVTAEFRLDGTRIEFAVGPYDRSKPLIIDPIIDYATWFPGTVTAVAVDASGAAYIAGEVNGPAAPTTTNAYQSTQIGSLTTFNPRQYVAKFSSDGSTLIFCTYLGGSGTDTTIGIVLDNSGNVVIAGSTTSSDFPVTRGAYLTQPPNQSPNSYVSKLSADGTALLWSTLLPAQGITDVGVDGSGNVFVLCSPLNTGIVTTSNALSSSSRFRWLGELDSAGAHLLFATYVPGLQGTSVSGAMAIRQDGTVWIAGTTLGYSLFEAVCAPAGSAPTPVALIGIDTNAVKVIANTSFGGSAADYGTGLQFDGAGSFYVSGLTCSADFPGIDSSVVPNRSVAAFVMKLDAAGQTPLWTAAVEDYIAEPVRVAVDPGGNVAILEMQDSKYSFEAETADQQIYYFDSGGNQIWTWMYSGLIGPALAMDSQGRIYAGSATGGTANAWESGKAWYNTYDTWAQGLTRITPIGGSLLVVPQTIWINPGQAYEGTLTDPSVFSTGGAGLPLPFTVSTTTPWLTIWDVNGVVTPLPNWCGSAQGFFALGLDGSQLQPGSYDGSITVTSHGFANSPLNVPVHVVIPSSAAPTTFIPPEIVIVGSGTGVRLGQYLASYGLNCTITFATCTIASATPWITPTSNGADAFIDDSSLPFGVNTGQIAITIRGDPNSPYQVTVIVIEGTYGDGYGGGSANFVAGPTSLSLLAQPGDAPKNATVGLWTISAQRAAFTAASEASWLAVSPAAGTTPWILSVTADPSGLQSGTYSTHIDIACNQAANGGARIPVTFTVQNDVPFNVDPAAVAVRLPDTAYSSNIQEPQVTLNLTSSQSMTYPAGAAGGGSCGVSYPAGTTPGQLTLSFVWCEPAAGGSGYIEITTSGNNVRNVPVTIVPSELHPMIDPGGIVNGATFAPGPVAPGSIVSIFGIDLADSIPATYSAPLPWVSPPFGNISLFPGSDEFAAFYQSSSQWNVQLPTTLQAAKYFLSVSVASTGESSSAPVAFTVAAVAPYIFTWGTNHGAVLNVDYSLNTPGSPAAAGSAIMVYLTGQGAVDPPVPTRQAAPSSPLSYTTAATTATIDGASASVSFSGLAPGYVGLCQVNVSIPDGLPTGQHKLMINIGGVNTNEVVFDTN